MIFAVKANSEVNCTPEMRYLCNGPGQRGENFEKCAPKELELGKHLCSRQMNYCNSQQSCENLNGQRLCTKEIKRPREFWDMELTKGKLCCDAIYNEKDPSRSGNVPEGFKRQYPKIP